MTSQHVSGCYTVIPCIKTVNSQKGAGGALSRHSAKAGRGGVHKRTCGELRELEVKHADIWGISDGAPGRAGQGAEESESSHTVGGWEGRRRHISRSSAF